MPYPLGQAFRQINPNEGKQARKIMDSNHFPGTDISSTFRNYCPSKRLCSAPWEVRLPSAATQMPQKLPRQVVLNFRSQ